MTRSNVVVAGFALAIAGAGTIGVMRLALAAPPAGYKCGKGGRKNVAKERCDCPHGKRPSRNAADEAVCKPKRRGEPVAVDDGPPVTMAPVTVGGADAGTSALTCPSEMVLVPGGTFTMGSPDVTPQHQVTLSPYCFDRTEVTVAAYEACATCTSAATTVDGPYVPDRKAWDASKTCNGSRTDRQRHPANCITWTQADAYCRAAGKRLPTEAEWEFAARGTDGRTYPWGNKDPSARRLNACGSECRAFLTPLRLFSGVMYEEDDGHAATAPVGSFPDGASPFGPLDMAGNVWEWLADEHAPYGAQAVTDPPPVTTAAAAGDKRYGLRGGSWAVGAAPWVRTFVRNAMAPSVRDANIGFRCARDGS